MEKIPSQSMEHQDLKPVLQAIQLVLAQKLSCSEFLEMQLKQQVIELILEQHLDVFKQAVEEFPDCLFFIKNYIDSLYDLSRYEECLHTSSLFLQGLQNGEDFYHLKVSTKINLNQIGRINEVEKQFKTLLII